MEIFMMASIDSRIDVKQKNKANTLQHKLTDWGFSVATSTNISKLSSAIWALPQGMLPA